MKKLVIPLLVSLFIIVACHKNSMPEITTRTKFPKAPKKATAKENSPEAIAAGKLIYEEKCNCCHALKDTRLYTIDSWSIILKTMIPRAKLTDEEAKQLTAFVTENAKK